MCIKKYHNYLTFCLLITVLIHILHDKISVIAISGGHVDAAHNIFLEVTTLKKIPFISLLLLLLLILIPGCITIQAPPSVTIPPLATSSVIGTFSSNPSTINSGGTTTLLWNVTGANSVSIDHGIGLVDVAGTRVVSPDTSTTYTISATNATGTVTRSVVTTVNAAPPPPERMPPVITVFSSNLNPDGTSTLWWNVTGADMVSIDQYIGIVDASGSKVVSPDTSMVYTLSATYAIGNWANEIGTVTKSVTIPASVSRTPLFN